MSTDKHEIYVGKKMVGPMVRGSTLPFRVSCLDFGADVVFSPGLVDLAIIESKRVEMNGRSLLVKSENNREKNIFDTIPEEKGRLIVQLITNDGPNATKALEILGDMPSAIDINCGCPEEFAVHRGCGSAMTIERINDVVKTIKRVSELPVSVKFRIKDTVPESIQFAKAIEMSGADALILHGRNVTKKHKGEIDYDHMRTVFESVGIHKISNGGISSLEGATEMISKTGCSSIMICGAALKNPSVFSMSPLTGPQALAHLCEVGKRLNTPYNEGKWSVQQIIYGCKAFYPDHEPVIRKAETWEDVSKAILNLI